MGERMLAGFALYNDTAAQPRPRGMDPDGKDHDTIHTPLGTRLLRIIRLARGWRVWTGTVNFRQGTYLELFDDGRVLNCTVRIDEGDDYFWARPSDETINKQRNMP
jgi:hypothetical protein